MGFEIRLDASKDLREKLSRDNTVIFKRIIIRILPPVMKYLSYYPPAPPRGNPWYERGVGMRHRHADGSITTRNTSEQLSSRWRTVILPDGRGKIENTASYAPLVHSARKQTRRHRRTGWRTDEQAVRTLMNDNTLKTVAREEIARFYG
jgi:hypothetical protein